MDARHLLIGVYICFRDQLAASLKTLSCKSTAAQPFSGQVHSLTTLKGRGEYDVGASK